MRVIGDALRMRRSLARGRRRWTGRLSLGLCALVLTGCGYQFTGRMAGREAWRLDVESIAAEPGLALVARRGLQAQAETFGLWLSPDAASGPRLHVRVVRASDEAVAIHAYPAHAAPDDPAATPDEADTPTPEDAVRATTYDVVVVLEARLYDASGALVGTHTACGTSPFGDALLPFATSDQRSRALERSVGVACRELAAWAVSQADRTVRSPPTATSPEDAEGTREQD